MTSRSELLGELLRAERPALEIAQDLASFAWDSDEDLVELTPRMVREVLDRFLSGSLPLHEVAQWADTIEGRDDIGFLATSESLLKKAIFELANPDLTGTLTPVRAQTLISELADQGGTTDATSRPSGRRER